MDLPDEKNCLVDVKMQNDGQLPKKNPEVVSINSSKDEQVGIHVNSSVDRDGNICKDKNYREEICSSDDDDSIFVSSSSTSVSSLSDYEKFDESDTREKVDKPTKVTRTRGELTLDDLPRIEDLNISVPEQDMKLIGAISGVVERLVVVQSLKDSSPLNIDSVLFLSGNKPLGRVFDVFGPVVQPLYAVRFNSAEDIMQHGIVKGDAVYFAPDHADCTMYVFVETLRKEKGSDASWKDNNEPPVECIDYSDDEQEKAARKQLRARKQRQEQNGPSAEINAKTAIKSEPVKHASNKVENPRIVNYRSGSFPNYFATSSHPQLMTSMSYKKSKFTSQGEVRSLHNNVRSQFTSPRPAFPSYQPQPITLRQASFTPTFQQQPFHQPQALPVVSAQTGPSLQMSNVLRPPPFMGPPSPSFQTFQRLGSSVYQIPPPRVWTPPLFAHQSPLPISPRLCNSPPYSYRYTSGGPQSNMESRFPMSPIPCTPVPSRPPVLLNPYNETQNPNPSPHADSSGAIGGNFIQPPAFPSQSSTWPQYW